MFYKLIIIYYQKAMDARAFTPHSS